VNPLVDLWKRERLARHAFALRALLPHIHSPRIDWKMRSQIARIERRLGKVTP
jgi:hypothetical protein